jgi:hypothetical protein
MLMATVCPTRRCGSQRPLGKTRHSLLVADETPPPAPRAKRRRRVFHTAGLTASAAVLALSIQAGSLNSDDDDPPVNQYGDATILDPDATE